MLYSQRVTIAGIDKIGAMPRDPESGKAFFARKALFFNLSRWQQFESGRLLLSFCAGQRTLFP